MHGFGASQFHAKCDNIPKTLTVIKATSGHIFGGYTEATWDQSLMWKRDEKAFIFSMRNKMNKPVKVNVKRRKANFAICCLALNGPQFGADREIFISQNSNAPNTNVASFSGLTYRLDNFPHYHKKAGRFLAGSDNFTVGEIEVFQLR